MMALPPATGTHRPGEGYVIYVSLTVDGCRGPVSGSATVVLPREFIDAERRTGLSRPSGVLFGLAVSDPEVRVVSVTAGENEQRAVWGWQFDDTDRVYASGVNAVARVDRWDRRHTILDVEFEADWLRARGYRRCWLAIPELVGPHLKTLGVHASDEIDRRLGPVAGVPPLMRGELEVDSTIEWHNPGEPPRIKREHEEQTNFYSEGGTPAALGSVSLVTGLAIDVGASRGKPPTFGTPSWNCRGSDQRDAGTGFLGQADDGSFSYSINSQLREYLPAENGRGCAAWIALSEAGAQTWRDIWLLLIGAALSAGIALLVEMAVSRRRNLVATDEPSE